MRWVRGHTRGYRPCRQPVRHCDGVGVPPRPGRRPACRQSQWFRRGQGCRAPALRGARGMHGQPGPLPGGVLALATKTRYANGHARRQVRAWLKAQGLPCHICGGAIDYDLPAGDPMSFEVDEIVPVSKGGSPIDRANVAPAHRICNERRGNKSLAALNGSISPRPRDVGCSTSLPW
nr:MAG TPA: CRISPR-associated endonuclease [Caudoviricetes sp.]